ncbi:MAG: hypothetical protein V4478_00345 [Patescibacteria group bacterium]
MNSSSQENTAKPLTVWDGFEALITILAAIIILISFFSSSLRYLGGLGIVVILLSGIKTIIVKGIDLRFVKTKNHFACGFIVLISLLGIYVHLNFFLSHWGITILPF